MFKHTRLSFLAPFTEWIFPRRCFLCQKNIARDYLCECCESLCHKCPNYFSVDKKDAALFYFELAIKTLIKEIKYNKKIGHVQALRWLIKEALSQSSLILDLKSFSPSIITYVPTHWINLIARKSDLPLLFSHILSVELQIKNRSLLIRKKFNSRQALRKTRKERVLGIVGSFALRPTKRRYERILLVDDIMTTGATMAESKKLLKPISDEVRGIAIAMTP